MNILTGESPYKDYHNPKLENACKLLENLMRCLIYSLAAAAIWKKHGVLTSALAMFTYFLLRQIVQNRIYFHSNRGFGPGWKQQLGEDSSFAIQYALASVGGAWLLIVLFP